MQDSDIEERRELINKLSCLVNKGSMEKLLQACALEDDDELWYDFDSILNMHKPWLWQSEREVIPAPCQNEVDGEIDLGMIYQGDMPVAKFKIPKSNLVRHLGIYAQTGHSKTTVLFNIIDQLLRDGVTVTYFDPKMDGRALLRKFKELVVLPWYAFPWNPLRNPPGMKIKDWWSNLSQICGYSFGWFIASSSYMLSHLEDLYENYEETGKYPTFVQLYGSVANTHETSRRKSEYHDSVENRLASLVFIFGNNFDVEVGIPLEKLCEIPCVIELHGLRPAEQNLMTEIILSWFYFYRLYQGHRGEELRHVIIVEEAHRIFDRSKEIRETAIEMGVPIINIFPSQFRDFGTSLIFASQQPSQIMNSVHSNTLIKIVGNLSSGIDIQSVSEAMGLDDELKDCIHKLKRAQWLVRMSDNYTEPFLIETPNYRIDKDVTDEEVIERLKSVFSEYLPKEVIDTETEVTIPRVITPQISSDAWLVLQHISEHPFTNISKRRESLKMSGRKFESAKQELVKSELVKEVPITFGRFRPRIYLVPTDKGISLLKSIGRDVRFLSHIAHQGFEHRLFVAFVKFNWEKTGAKAYTERVLSSGRRVDVLVFWNGMKIGIEVEVTTTNIQDKMREMEELDELHIIVKDLQTLRELKARTGYYPSKQIRFYQIGDYLQFLKMKSTNKIGSEIDGRKSFERTKLKSTSFRTELGNKSSGKNASDSRSFDGKEFERGE